MKIEFEFTNEQGLRAELDRVLRERGGAIRRVPASALRRGTFELLVMVQDLAPKKTATFVRSITAVVEKISADLSQGKVGSHLEYARYLEEGTGVFGPKGQPFQILPSAKKALFWGAFDGGGRALIRKSVIIQGMKPRAPFGTAIARFIPRYEAIIQEELAKGLAA